MNIYPLTIYYDGNCPVCAIEINMLRQRCEDGSLRFVDIHAPEFDPTPLGKPLEALNARIHAVRADSLVVEGPEVFALAYRAVGLDALADLISWAPLKPVIDWLYGRFARHRHRLGQWLGPCLERQSSHRMKRQRQTCSGQCSPSETLKTGEKRS